MITVERTAGGRIHVLSHLAAPGTPAADADDRNTAALIGLAMSAGSNACVHHLAFRTGGARQSWPLQANAREP